MRSHSRTEVRITLIEANEQKQVTVCLPSKHEHACARIGSREWIIEYGETEEGTSEVGVTLTKGETAECLYELLFSYQGHTKEDYLLLPAAIYDSNRFDSQKVPYPPMLETDTFRSNPGTPFITDVPRFDTRGREHVISLSSGDLSTPLAAWFSPSERSMGILSFSHRIEGSYTGIRLEEDLGKGSLKVILQAPCSRDRSYSSCRIREGSDDLPLRVEPSHRLSIPFSLCSRECDSVSELLEELFFLRYKGFDTSTPASCIPFSKAFDTIERDYNANQYNLEYGYYRVAPVDEGNRFTDWQAGWVGGAMNSLALRMQGDELSVSRSDTTIDTLFASLQYPSGLIYPVFAEGRLYGDNFLTPDDTRWVLTRKSADVLLFVSRYIEYLQDRGEQVKPSWLTGLSLLADAFCELFERHGQFGQFIDARELSLFVEGTASGSTAVAGLAICSELFGNESYLTCAREAAGYYHEQYLCKGFANGGPGEILQAPDSESSFGLLESYIELYERTKEKRWLEYSKQAMHLAATWVMDYDFSFPEASIFARLGMKTRGTVWANVQNKHSAPGICTLSGVSGLKLYRATGIEEYMTISCDIARSLMQFVSLEERPILDFTGKLLPAGWINERVNTSDWEGKARIGEVFYGACWPAVSALLTFSEFPGIYVDTEFDRVFVADHLEVRNDGDSLVITNDTPFDARTSILLEDRVAKESPLGSDPLSRASWISIGAHSSIRFSIDL